ncbi:MAG: multicopper oxidase domain-containing protein [Casimicrobiaceae bacterium]
MSDTFKHEYTRRDFLKLSWTVSAGVVVPALLSACNNGDGSDTPETTFPQPQTLQSVNGVLDITLNLAYLDTTLYGTKVSLRNMSGTIPAPTLLLNVGDTLRIKLVNSLPPNPQDRDEPPHLRYHNSTNLHTHGFHVYPGIIREPSSFSAGLYGDYVLDDPEKGVHPGQSRQYEYEIRQDHPAGVYWYHPHLHGSSAMQVGSGMAGAVLIKGPIDQVPEIAAAAERVFVFQAPFQFVTPPSTVGTIDNFAQVANNPTSEPAFLVNGLRRPRLTMRSGEVQNWRFVNASIWKFLNLSLDGHVLNIYGHDGNPRHDLKPSGPFSLNDPTMPDGVVLAPGNRNSILVRAGVPGTYFLRTMAFEMGRASNQGASILADDVLVEVVVLDELQPMELPRAPFPVTPFLAPITDEELAAHGGLKRNIVMRVVFNPNGAPITQPPASLIVHPGDDLDDWVYTNPSITPPPSITNKVFALGSAGVQASPNPGMPAEYIPFQSTRALTQTVAFDSVEEWTILNMNNIRHPFHIHVNPMYIVKINGRAIEPYWADTIGLPPDGSPEVPTTVTFRMRFVHYSGPYVMHCHMLVHEDMGMMQGVTVA